MNAPARSSPMTRAASSAQGMASARRGNRISIIAGPGRDGERRDCYYTRMAPLEVNGQGVHYVQTGSGAPALVLIHGAGGDHTTWMRQLEGLTDSATVVALDLPGHGASAGDGCRAVSDYATVVRGLLAALGRGPVVLGGHSMGGAITQAVALTAPELLQGLVLVGTGARLRVFPKLFELMEKDYAEGVAFVTRYAWSPSTREALKAGGRRTMSATRPAVTIGDFTAGDGVAGMDRVGLTSVRAPAPPAQPCGRPRRGPSRPPPINTCPAGSPCRPPSVSPR